VIVTVIVLVVAAVAVYGRTSVEPLARRTSHQQTGRAVADRRVGRKTLGGILIIVGILVTIFGSFVLGSIISLIGLIVFAGLVPGKRY
jgi:hypothetical protein